MKKRDRSKRKRRLNARTIRAMQLSMVRAVPVWISAQLKSLPK